MLSNETIDDLTSCRTAALFMTVRDSILIPRLWDVIDFKEHNKSAVLVFLGSKMSEHEL